MPLTRRRFLQGAAPLGLSLVPSCGGVDTGTRLLGSEPEPDESPFLHGVASGDPLANAVILWTRVTPPVTEEKSQETESMDVEWRVALDADMVEIVTGGNETTDASKDFTVKIDVVGLEPGTTYYFDFGVGGLRSVVGRTRTLPSGAAARARLAVTSCANYPAGYFNVYRIIAERTDVDLVVHVGDYLYEYQNGSLGDGTAIGRVPSPDREAVSLEDYRARHAQYKLDSDLQELHRQHPFIAVWDDHEVADNAFSGGADNHQPDSEGEWEARKESATRAYFEWMPIRAFSPGDMQRVYRAFEFGDLFDLIMLDTRLHGRDARIAGNCDVEGIQDPARTLLGSEQEEWLLSELRASTARGARWRLVGQQVMFGQLSDLAKGCVAEPDQWDGYAQGRARVFGALRDEGLDNVVILTGDAHSSWAFDLAEQPFDPALYDAATGEGSLAVEFVAPGVSSPGDGAAVDEFLATHPHLKFAETTRRGYVLLDLTPERIQAEWYFVRTVDERDDVEELGAAFQVRAGQNRLERIA